MNIFNISVPHVCFVGVSSQHLTLFSMSQKLKIFQGFQKKKFEISLFLIWIIEFKNMEMKGKAF